MRLLCASSMSFFLYGSIYSVILHNCSATWRIVGISAPVKAVIISHASNTAGYTLSAFMTIPSRCAGWSGLVALSAFTSVLVAIFSVPYWFVCVHQFEPAQSEEWGRSGENGVHNCQPEQ